MQTAHSDKISGLAFPHQYGEVFATCSLGCIRVWHLRGCRELLRISLPNLECRCVTFAPVRGHNQANYQDPQTAVDPLTSYVLHRTASQATQWLRLSGSPRQGAA